MANSFYDLDYIISINEKRVDDYSTAYQKVQERLTNIILIYSGIAIYLVPIIQDLFRREIEGVWLYLIFGVFLCLFIISVVFTVRFLIPLHISDLDFPEKYYKKIRLEYEGLYPKLSRDDLDMRIKGSYIDELERAVADNFKVFAKKRSFYNNALIYGLASAIPYLICAGFHVTKKDEEIQKVKIVNQKISCIFDKKIDYGYPELYPKKTNSIDYCN